MEIEKLERYGQELDFEGYKTGGCNKLTTGEHVLYTTARAREDSLLEALKYCLNSLDDYGFGGTVIATQRAVVRQIEATQ